MAHRYRMFPSVSDVATMVEWCGQARFDASRGMTLKNCLDLGNGERVEMMAFLKGDQT